MGKMFAALFVIMLAMPACKSEKCGKYYDKMTECGIPVFGISRGEFIEKCKSADNNDEVLECADRSSCEAFISCVD